MPNCEGRSRRCGVILIYCADNGYFVAYTSPPPTAELLLKEKPFGGHSVQLSLVAELVCHTQPTSPWHADFNRRGLAKPDHRGKMKNRPGGVYSRPSDSSFSLPRGHKTSVPPSSFINLTFTSQRSLLWYFLGLQESTVLPVSPRLLPVSSPPPLPIKKASPRLSGPASLQYKILAGKAAHYSALSTYMATNSTLSTYISTGTSLTLPRHTLITV